ncbi:MAG: NAD(P)-binding protein [Gemmatimonadetes bacterium]|nr:NAD(P)-binding protein [Gemmatimonadota bacterium]
MSTPTFAVVGAGLAGPLMALNLGRLGYDVELFEQLEDPRATGGGAARARAGAGAGAGAVRSIWRFRPGACMPCATPV